MLLFKRIKTLSILLKALEFYLIDIPQAYQEIKIYFVF